MTRVLYEQVAEGEFKSTKVFLCNTALVEVYLFHNTLTFVIVDIDTGEMLAHGDATNLVKLKKLAKDTLKVLGANFDDILGKKRMVLK